MKRPPLDGRAFDWQPLWLPLSVMGALAVAASFLPAHGYDLMAYWRLDPQDPYRATDFVGFRYAPPTVALLMPLRLLPWETVVALWLALQLAALWYIGRRWFLVLVLFPPVWLDVVYGNVNIFLAGMVVASFRHPAPWTFGLFTKVTPAVGAIWMVGRRDWRALAVLAFLTAGIIAVSLVIQGPQIWADWLAILRTSSNTRLPPDALPIPLLPRVIVAAGVVLWGGWTDRRWTVPVAVTLAMPILWVIALAPLVALSAKGGANAGTKRST